MCLLLVAWQSHPDYPLVVAGNRDEFYTRRTRPAAWWGQSVSVLAGRDEEAGGTWLGITRRGRIAMLTNVRAPTERNPHAPSRGLLVLSALQSPQTLGNWVGQAAERNAMFNGFNLLVGEPLATEGSALAGHLMYVGNRVAGGPQPLAAGLYGVSNAGLDTPWPKLTRSVARYACQLAQQVDVGRLLELLADRELARDDELPSTGVPLDWERALSAVQIRANGYGTRTSTVVTVRRDGLVQFVERSFDPQDPEQHQDRRFEFTIDASTRTAAARGPSPTRGPG